VYRWLNSSKELTRASHCPRPRNGDPIIEDEYLTHNSENFHAHLGFTKVGTFHKCGRKFDRWYNMIWMEKIIGQHT
jgi:phosphinothricin acetyltransferase